MLILEKMSNLNRVKKKYLKYSNRIDSFAFLSIEMHLENYLFKCFFMKLKNYWIFIDYKLGAPQVVAGSLCLFK